MFRKNILFWGIFVALIGAGFKELGFEGLAILLGFLGGALILLSMLGLIPPQRRHPKKTV